jgi:hypothetical protein
MDFEKKIVTHYFRIRKGAETRVYGPLEFIKLLHFPKQQEFLECVFSGSYDIILYGGAIRGGKIFAGLVAILLLCMA